MHPIRLVWIAGLMALVAARVLGMGANPPARPEGAASPPPPAAILKQRVQDAEQALQAAGEQLKTMERLRVELDREGGKQQQIDVQSSDQSANQLRKALAKEKALDAETQEQIGRLAEARMALDREIIALTARLDESRKRLASGADADQALAGLRSELDNESQARAAAEATLDRAQQALAAAEQKLAGLRKECGATEKSAAKFKAHYDEQAQRIRAGLDREAKLKSGAEAEAGRLAAQCAALEEEIGQLASRRQAAEKLQAEQAERERAAEALRSQVADEQRQKAAADKRADELQVARRRLEGQAEELQAALRKMEDRSAAMERRLGPAAGLQAEFDLARQAHQQAAAAVAAETNAQALAESRLNLLAGKMESFAGLIESMQKQVESLASRNEALRRDLERKAGAPAKVENAAAGKIVPPPAADRPAVPAASGTEAPAAAGGENVLAAEQRILAEARSGGVRAGERKAAAAGPPGAAPVPKLRELDRHYQAGIQKWDQGDTDGAIAEFRAVIRLDPSAAGAYYNLAVAYFKKNDQSTACDYAYEAGRIYARNQNAQQAMRMLILLKNMDPTSRLIEKLRKEIAKPAK